jgi:hypothetical protein
MVIRGWSVEGDGRSSSEDEVSRHRHPKFYFHEFDVRLRRLKAREEQESTKSDM